MEKRNGNLIAFRPDIKVVDCTLRDGGLVNNFGFTDEFVKDLYRTNIKAGVDYMEFGYKASKEIFSKEDYGKWKFCEEEDIRAIVGNNDFDLKIAVMSEERIIRMISSCEIQNTTLFRSWTLFRNTFRQRKIRGIYGDMIFLTC